MLENKITLGSKLEGTPYTAETLALADYNLNVRDLSYNFNIAEYKRKYLTGKLSNAKSIMGKQEAGISFTIDFAEGTTILIPHGITKLIQACAHREVHHFAEAGDNNNQLSTYTDIDGVVFGTNTSAGGIIYISIVDDTGGFFHFNLYKDSGRTQLVGHSATYNTTGKKAIVADNASGLSGFITVTAVTAADVDMTITIVGVSWIPHSRYTTKPITLEVCEMDEGLTPNQLITKIAGAMGTFKMVVNTVGDPIRVEFDFKGKLTSISDRTFANMIEAVSDAEGVTPNTLSFTATHNSIEQQLDKLTLDAGNSLQMKVLASDPTGFAGCYVESRLPTISCDPYTRLLAGEADYTDWINAVLGSFLFAAGNYHFSAPNAQKIKIAPAARNGMRVYDKTFLLTGTSAGDDEYRILQGSLT